MGLLVPAATTVEDAKICHSDFVVVHVYGKNNSTVKTFLAMVTTSVGHNYITVMYTKTMGKKVSTGNKEEWSFD